MSKIIKTNTLKFCKECGKAMTSLTQTQSLRNKGIRLCNECYKIKYVNSESVEKTHLKVGRKLIRELIAEGRRSFTVKRIAREKEFHKDYLNHVFLTCYEHGLIDRVKSGRTFRYFLYFNQGTKWTDEDKEFLIDRFGKIPLEQVCRKLGRNKASIKSYHNYLMNNKNTDIPLTTTEILEQTNDEPELEVIAKIDKAIEKYKNKIEELQLKIDTLENTKKNLMEISTGVFDVITSPNIRIESK